MSLSIEPTTRSMHIKPVQQLVDYKNNSMYQAYKMRLADFYHTQHWEEMPRQGNLQDPPSDYYYRTKQPSNINMIDALTIPDTDNITTGGRELIPILKSIESFVANQGFYISIEYSGRSGQVMPDYIAVVFGDFCLSLHTDGSMDLYWSQDGSNTASSWLWCKRFASIGAKRAFGTSMLLGAPVKVGSLLNLFIMPMGRGNLLVGLENEGSQHWGVFSHPMAELDSQTGIYSITKPGSLAIYTNKADAKAIGLQASKLAFGEPFTFSCIDGPWDLPYAPTTDPQLTLYWSKTMPGCNAWATLLDENKATWVSDGINKKCYVQISITTDGLCSPFIDGYGLYFPPKTRTYTPVQIDVPHECIQKLSFEDGEEWDDQRITVDIEDDGRFASLRTRGKIHGRLLIDGAPYTVATFTDPQFVMRKGVSTLTLQGKNYGVSKVNRKHFVNAPTFDGILHTEAIQRALNLCGFALTDIDVSPDIVVVKKIPGLSGKAGNEFKEDVDPKSQPAFNQPVTEFINWVISTFSNWSLKYGADGRWIYKPKEKPTTYSAIFYKKTTKIGPPYVPEPVTLPWYNEPVISVESAEANQVQLYGMTDSGQIICNIARRQESINQIGIEPVVVVDTSIPDMQTLNECLELLSEAALFDRVLIEWKGPFYPSLKVGDGVWLEDIGLVQIIHLRTEGISPNRLEHGDSTTYTGVILPVEAT